jgi:hypothetical protein
MCATLYDRAGSLNVMLDAGRGASSGRGATSVGRSKLFAALVQQGRGELALAVRGRPATQAPVSSLRPGLVAQSLPLAPQLLDQPPDLSIPRLGADVRVGAVGVAPPAFQVFVG